MQLWGQYIKERLDADIIFDDKGFLSYKKLDKVSVLIMDVYLSPDSRNLGNFRKFARELYDREAPEVIFCESVPTANHWSKSDSFIRSWGLKPIVKRDDAILYMTHITDKWKLRYLGKDYNGR